MNAVFEPGLPGSGPEPIHLHTGKPTPWKQGAVLRVSTDSGAEWIANLQPGFWTTTAVVKWTKANALFVFVNGATYFIPPDAPIQWRLICTEGTECIFAADGQLALVATFQGIIAVWPNGDTAWSRLVAVDGIANLRIEDELVFGDAGIDPPHVWEPFILRLSDGVMLSPR